MLGSGIRWTNLHPQRLLDSMKSFNFNFPFDTLDDFMKRVRRESTNCSLLLHFRFLLIVTIIDWFWFGNCVCVSGRNHQRLSGEALPGPDGPRVPLIGPQQELDTGKTRLRTWQTRLIEIYQTRRKKWRDRQTEIPIEMISIFKNLIFGLIWQTPDIGAELTGGCYGFATKFMHWPEDLVVGGTKKNKTGHIVK